MNLSPWQLIVYTDGSKSTTVATITRINGFTLAAELDNPKTMQFAGITQDYTFANVDRGMYFELKRARSGTKTLWNNGYIQTATKDSAGQFSIDALSSMWSLNKFRTLRDFAAGPGTNYTDVRDFLQGLGSTAPEHQGLLPPGWTVQWIDGGRSLTPPGVGDILEGGGETSFTDVTDMLHHYHINCRESTSVTNTAYSGKLDIGPLGDSSGLVIWGADAALADLIANHGYPATAKRADLRTLQQNGYAVISNAQMQSDNQSITNIAWVRGKNGHSIHHIAGGPPLDAGGSVQNGWALFTPTHPHHGRPYYTKSASSYATYEGQVFSFVAAQNNGGDSDASGGWDYGIIDTTSFNTYGPMEEYLDHPTVHDARHLTAIGVAYVAEWSQPVQSWVFSVAHPLTSASGNPQRAEPGQTVAVHYTASVPEVERNTNGQFVPTGNSFTYFDYPGTSDTNAIRKLKRITRYEEEWSDGQFVQTLTLGTSAVNMNSVADDLVRQLLKHRQRRERTHSFKKYSIHSIPFLCSTTPLAYDREKEHTLYMNPGSIAVSDTPHTQFFTDGHSVVFTTAITDGTEYLDFWINKPVDNDTLLTPNPTPGGGATRSYLLFRLACTASPNSGTNSATQTRFYSTANGTAFTQRGIIHRIPLLDDSFRIPVGTYRVKIGWQGGKFQAWIESADVSMPAGIQAWQHAATFNDVTPAVANNNWGAIGWMLHQGSAVAKIWDLHAVDSHPGPVEKNGVGRAQEHGAKAEPRSYRVTSSNANRFGSIGVPKAETPL